MSIIFSTTKMLYNISGLGGPAIFKYPMYFCSTCPWFSLMVKTYSFTALKANGITEDIFIKFRAPVRLFLIYKQVSTNIFCQHRASIFAFCSKLSRQCIKDFTIMLQSIDGFLSNAYTDLM